MIRELVTNVNSLVPPQMDRIRNSEGGSEHSDLPQTIQMTVIRLKFEKHGSKLSSSCLRAVVSLSISQTLSDFSLSALSL